MFGRRSQTNASPRRRIFVGTCGAITGGALIGLFALPAIGGRPVTGPTAPVIRDAGSAEPRQLAPSIILSEGVRDGKPWTLTAHESSVGRCLELYVGKDSVGSCGSGVPDSQDMSVNVGSQGGLKVVYGETAPAIETVRIDTAAAPAQEVHPVAAPAEGRIQGELSDDTSFYAVPVSTGDDVQVVEALDEGGQVLQSYQPPSG